MASRSLPTLLSDGAVVVEPVAVERVADVVWLATALSRLLGGGIGRSAEVGNLLGDEVGKPASYQANRVSS